MKLILAVLFLVYLMARPEASLIAARQAMALWAQAVAPALFPFMALLPLFTGEEARAIYRRVARRPMACLFRLPPEAAAAVAVGWIAGSPTGSLALARTAGNGLNDRQALTAGILTSCCGPVFLVCSVGAGMFGDSLMGAKLLVCAGVAHVATALIVARMPARHRGMDKAPALRNHGEDASAMRAAVLGILTVGGWMSLFAVIGSALGQTVKPFLEVSAGCAQAACAGQELLAAFICGFGGVCAGCQNLDALKGLGVRSAPFFACKLLVGGLSAALYAALARLPWPRGTCQADSLRYAALAALGLALTITIIIWARGEKSPRGAGMED